jgi:hypothetical protein
MTFDQMPTLPVDLNARFRYLCQSRTVHGSLQAKCYFLHEGIEYSGILFSPDGEEWFDKLEDGMIINATRIAPCQDERYAGEYKGTALSFDQQKLPFTLDQTEKSQCSIDLIDMPALLREAANKIEMLLDISKNQQAKESPAIQQKTDPEFRGFMQWADVITDIIARNSRFQTEPFSVLTLNAYIFACFNDFWEGDLVKMHNNVPRWQRMISRAIAHLLDVDFIERVPGTQKHYQVTQDTLAQIF